MFAVRIKGQFSDLDVFVIQLSTINALLLFVYFTITITITITYLPFSANLHTFQRELMYGGRHIAWK